MELEIFGDGWVVLEITVRAIIMYLFAVLLLRVFGKRTTMTTAGYDFVLTIALGSILASTVVSTSRPIAQGMAAIAAIAALQWVLSRAVSRSETVQEIVVSPARLLLKDGEIVRANLLHERLSVEQLEQNIRGQGFASTDEVAAAVLESNGSISVLGQSESGGKLITEKEIGSRSI